MLGPPPPPTRPAPPARPRPPPHPPRHPATAAQRHWLELKETRLAHIAAELADRLTDGEPCEVCGATSHPHPATRADGHVDQRAEDAAHAAYRRSDAGRAEAERALGVVREELAAATAAATTAEGAGQAAQGARLAGELSRAGAAAERV
ncbi:SMC family ATPase, partial [Streptomyces albidoflavus]